MGKLEFGITMLVSGMGGTLVSLYLLSLMIRLIKVAFPRQVENKPAEAAGTENKK
ncbi:MAG: OadG family protein [Thermodesulfobacteriota bacterium]